MTLLNNWSSTPFSAYYDVSYGDGQTLTAYHATGGMFGVEYYDEHQYANAGTYTVTIAARLTPTGPVLASETYQVTVTNSGQCSKVNKVETFTYDIDATHKLRCTIEYKNRWTLMRFWVCDGIGTAEYFVKNGNNWQNVKASTIGAWIQSYAYKKDETDCILYTGSSPSGLWLDQTGAKNNAKSVTASKKGHGPVVKYLTIEGLFKVTINNQVYQKYFTMSAGD